MPNQNQAKYVPAGTGPMYWGPGDRVSFLATGADSQGGCFIFEGLTVPGGGPPPPETAWSWLNRRDHARGSLLSNVDRKSVV